jgi:hypothetical protein
VPAIFDAVGTLTDSGVILAPTLNNQEIGVLMENGGVIVNNAGGTISGYNGVVLVGSSTVTNAGTIEAGKTSAIAVEFSSAVGNKLIILAAEVVEGSDFARRERVVDLHGRPLPHGLAVRWLWQWLSEKRPLRWNTGISGRVNDESSV